MLWTRASERARVEEARHVVTGHVGERHVQTGARAARQKVVETGSNATLIFTTTFQVLADPPGAWQSTEEAIVNTRQLKPYRFELLKRTVSKDITYAETRLVYRYV